MATLTLQIDGPLDLVGILGPLRRGFGDPTLRLGASGFDRAARTPDGPAAMSARLSGDQIQVEAWGPGAERLVSGLPALLGLDDDDRAFQPRLHPVVADLARRRRGLRIGRTGGVFDVLVPAILEQRITGTEAFRSFRRLVMAHGEAAPGPTGLRVPPGPEVIAALPSWSFPSLGIEPRRGALLRRVARDASRLEQLADGARQSGGGGVGAAVLIERLQAYTGIGPWTAAEVTIRALGDPDAVSLGDAHLPHLVAWALTGRPRGTDEGMLALLEPWRGQRARVIRLLESGGLAAPRFGPRVTPRDLTDLAPDRRARGGAGPRSR